MPKKKTRRRLKLQEQASLAEFLEEVGIMAWNLSLFPEEERRKLLVQVRVS